MQTSAVLPILSKRISWTLYYYTIHWTFLDTIRGPRLFYVVALSGQRFSRVGMYQRFIKGSFLLRMKEVFLTTRFRAQRQELCIEPVYVPGAIQNSESRVDMSRCEGYGEKVFELTLYGFWKHFAFDSL